MIETKMGEITLKGSKAELIADLAVVVRGIKETIMEDGKKTEESVKQEIDEAVKIGNQSAATNTGDQSAATNTGDWSAATVEGKESVAMAIGYNSKAKGSLGCFIVLAECKEMGGEYHIVDVKSAKVDGEKIKPDTFYKLINGEFVEADKE